MTRANCGGMRLLAVASTLVGVMSLAACESTNEIASASARSVPAPTAVNCGDAPQLKQRALDDRRQSDETNSDQEKIVTRNRAVFYASLAIIADLKCRVTLAEADDALKPAFDAARKAEATRSFYERAEHWGEAGFVATQAIPMLLQQLAVPPSK